MKSRPRRDLDRMRQFHREKLAEAKNVFNDYPKMGSDAMSCTFMDVLIKARPYIAISLQLLFFGTDDSDEEKVRGLGEGDERKRCGSSQRYREWNRKWFVSDLKCGRYIPDV
ncbi:hypothetical protein MRX96_031355 [Rhipicephalus microplus]